MLNARKRRFPLMAICNGENTMALMTCRYFIAHSEGQSKPNTTGCQKKKRMSFMAEFTRLRRNKLRATGQILIGEETMPRTIRCGSSRRWIPFGLNIYCRQLIEARAPCIYRDEASIAVFS